MHSIRLDTPTHAVKQVFASVSDWFSLFGTRLTGHGTSHSLSRFSKWNNLLCQATIILFDSFLYMAATNGHGYFIDRTFTTMWCWRRGWDSNPRALADLRFSRPVHSTRLCDPSMVERPIFIEASNSRWCGSPRYRTSSKSLHIRRKQW